MSKNKKESFFWTSYSDLMTSLFFVMLILFVLTIALLHKGIEAKEAELEQIRKINKSIEKIDTTYFEYNRDFQRHTLKNVEVSFKPLSANIEDVSYSDKQRLINAGLAIKKFLEDAQKEKDLVDAQYLLIIEGQSSRDSYADNFVLSYKRALSLYELWKSNEIQFDSLPSCEVIISGSGDKSKFREYPETISIVNPKGGLRTIGNPQNQRFVIHIIPKPGVAEQR